MCSLSSRSFDDSDALSPACPDCGTLIGERHRRGCDVERCSVCGRQRLFCGCVNHGPDVEAWMGEWPGCAEAQAHGWFARRAPVGWVPCGSDEEGAREDLNSLSFFNQMGYDGLYDT